VHAARAGGGRRGSRARKGIVRVLARSCEWRGLYRTVRQREREAGGGNVRGARSFLRPRLTCLHLGE
jgi:hypothetical protein